MRRVMIRDGHAVQRDNLERLTIKLEIDIAVRRGIHNSPEFSFAGGNRNARANGAVDGKDFLRSLSLSAASARRLFHSFQQGRCLRIVRDSLPSHDHYLLAEITNFRNVAFHPLNYDRAGHSITHLAVTLTMRMSVIPEQARRMTLGN